MAVSAAHLAAAHDAARHTPWMLLHHAAMQHVVEIQKQKQRRHHHHATNIPYLHLFTRFRLVASTYLID